MLWAINFEVIWCNLPNIIIGGWNIQFILFINVTDVVITGLGCY